MALMFFVFMRRPFKHSTPISLTHVFRFCLPGHRHSHKDWPFFLGWRTGENPRSSPFGTFLNDFSGISDDSEKARTFNPRIRVFDSVPTEAGLIQRRDMNEESEESKVNRHNQKQIPLSIVKLWEGGGEIEKGEKRRYEFLCDEAVKQL